MSNCLPAYWGMGLEYPPMPSYHHDFLWAPWMESISDVGYDFLQNIKLGLVFVILNYDRPNYS